MRPQDIIPMPARITMTGETLPEIPFEQRENDFASPSLDAAVAALARTPGRKGDVAPRLRMVPDLFADFIADADIRNEAYRLTVARDAVTIEAASARGAFYALKTLKAMVTGGRLTTGVIEDWPSLKFRGVHLTLGNGHMPRFERFLEIVRTLADYKLNALVIEYDDRFPWKRHPDLTHPNSYSLDQLETLIRTAEENFIEVIPLLDSLGHAQQYLTRDQYRHLRERPESIEEMCPSNPETLEFIKELWEEVLKIHKNSRYAHISGDEVFRLREGFCRRCAEYAARGRLGELYGAYYAKLSRWIIAQGKIPIVWGDMLLKHPDSIDAFPRDIVINDWIYKGADVDQWDFRYYRESEGGRTTPERDALFAECWKSSTPGKFRPFPTSKFFVDRGFRVIGASAASDENLTLYPITSLRERFLNNKNFAKALKGVDADGLLITFWSAQVSFEGAWLGTLAGADFAWRAREESFARFVERFSAAFLGQDQNFAAALADLDKKLYALTGPGSEPIALNPATSADPIARQYLKMVELSAALGEIDATLRRFRELLFGGGDGAAISLDAAANSSSADCMPPSAPFFQFPKGVIRVGGTEFHMGERYVTAAKAVPEYRSPDPIAVKARFASIGVLSSCHSAPEGETVARMVFRYADGGERAVAFTAGVNTHDWWGSGRTLTDGLAAFTGQVEYQARVSAYATLIENPFPDKKIVDLKFEPVSASGRLVAMAMTGVARSAASVPPTAEAVDRVERSLREIGEKIMASHADIIPRDEAAAAVARILAPRAIAADAIRRAVKKEVTSYAQEIYAH